MYVVRSTVYLNKIGGKSAEKINVVAAAGIAPASKGYGPSALRLSYAAKE